LMRRQMPIDVVFLLYGTALPTVHQIPPSLTG